MEVSWPGWVTCGMESGVLRWRTMLALATRLISHEFLQSRCRLGHNAMFRDSEPLASELVMLEGSP
jgi:hypothetical protein